MEYSADDGETWTTASDTETAVKPGTYLVRIKATTTAPAGKTTEVTVDDNLEEAKKKAKEELADYRAAVDDVEYDEDGIDELDSAVTDGNSAIDDATDEEAVKTALENSKKEIDAVKTKADKVEDAINALPDFSNVTTENKAAIEAARAAYDALTDDQKAKVSADTLKKLTDAEDKLVVLQAMREVSAKTGSGMTYTGNPIQLINTPTTALPAGYTMYYAVTTENVAPTDDNLYTTSIPTATDTGTYYVWYMVKGDDDHNDSSAAGPVKVTIAEAAGTYSQKSTQGTEHVLGEDKTAVYTVTNSADDDRAYDRFTQVSVDGTVIAAGNYTTAKGSLVLTLKSAYLNTLTAGEHTVKISFTDGEVSTSLKIMEATPTPTPTPTATPTPTTAPTTVPKTGDASMPFLWLALILTGILGIGTLTAVKRRK